MMDDEALEKLLAEIRISKIERNLRDSIPIASSCIEIELI